MKSQKELIADRIREILAKKGLKQQYLADTTGMSKAYISHILSGDVNLTLESIEALERALKEKIIEVKR